MRRGARRYMRRAVEYLVRTSIHKIIFQFEVNPGGMKNVIAEMTTHRFVIPYAVIETATTATATAVAVAVTIAAAVGVTVAAATATAMNVVIIC